MSRTRRYREAARVGLSSLDDALYAAQMNPWAELAWVAAAAVLAAILRWWWLS